MIVLHRERITVAVSATEELLLVMQMFECAADGFISVNMILESALIALKQFLFVHPLCINSPFRTL